MKRLPLLLPLILIGYFQSPSRTPDHRARATNRMVTFNDDGATRDDGTSWSWTAVTSNSAVDNIRPIVPKWDGNHTALIWLRGKYAAYTNYDLDVVGTITTRPARLRK